MAENIVSSHPAVKILVTITSYLNTFCHFQQLMSKFALLLALSGSIIIFYSDDYS